MWQLTFQAEHSYVYLLTHTSVLVCPAVLRQLHLTTKVFTQAAVQHQSLIVDIVEQSDCSQVDATVKLVAYRISKGLAEEPWVSLMHACMLAGQPNTHTCRAVQVRVIAMCAGAAVPPLCVPAVLASGAVLALGAVAGPRPPAPPHTQLPKCVGSGMHESQAISESHTSTSFCRCDGGLQAA
jgi:hypothetical protein